MNIAEIQQLSTQRLQKDVLSILDDVLHLLGRGNSFRRDTPLIGALPELDSLGVVALLTAFEERLNISVEDDEIDGATFLTVGTLVDYIARKVT